MEQELASLRTQLEEQQASPSSLTENLTRLNNAVSRAASTQEVPEGSREQAERTREKHHRRISGLEWGTSDFRLSVDAINETLGNRADAERRTGLSDLQELRDGLSRFQEHLDASRAQSKREYESLKAQTRSLEERAASSRS